MKRQEVPRGDEGKSRLPVDVSGLGDLSARRRRHKIFLLVILGLIHIFVTLFTVVPGYLSQDEIFYHWMADSLARRGSLDLWNGYGEFPSTELVHPLATAHGNRIFPAYPYLSAVLAFPFYLVAGFFGLFILNSLCFTALVALCFFTARALFHDTDLALNSCFILIFGTFAWEYSQSAWPHCSSALFVLGAFFLFVKAYWADSRHSACLFALASGLLGGLAVGIRIDCVIVFAGLLFPFLFSRPCRPFEAFMIIAGALPGLSLLAITNYLKFGVFNPLTYGRALVMSSVPGWNVVLPIAVGVLLAWVLSRQRVIERFEGRLVHLYVVGAVLLIVVLLSVKETRELATTLPANAYAMLVDVRSLNPDLSFPPMSRTGGGAVVYNGALKKSLLQSLPFLPLILLPVWSLFCRGKDRSAVLVSMVVPAGFLAYHGYAFLQLEAGGGLCFNLRYLTPCLPFLAVLSAYGIRDLQDRMGRPFGLALWAVTGLFTAAVYFLLVGRPGLPLDRLEFPLLVLPLLMTLVLLCLLVCGLIAGSKGSARLKTATWTVLIAAMTWAGLTAFFYDYPNHRRPRVVHHGFARMLLPKIPNDSIFFAGHGFFTASSSLLEKGGVRIAYPARDNYADFPNLLAYHLKAGRRAFGVFYRDHWSRLEAGPLKEYSVTPVLTFPAFYVAEISSPRSRSGPPASSR